MAARIIDGKAIALAIREQIKLECEKLKADYDVMPGLAVILVGDNPASQVYVKMKRKACEEIGVLSELYEFPATATQAEIINQIAELNSASRIHGILVQLPLPAQINEQEVLYHIDLAKDVDGFHPVSFGRLALGLDGFVPCTPLGIKELINRAGIDTRGAHLVVVGRSNIVGKPLALLMMQKQKGADATVTVCHSRTKNLQQITQRADILVAAIGRAKFVTVDMVKPGAVVIDVGVNRVDDPESPKGYRLVGDVDFEKIKEVASAITPVPGGVGPMTIAMLLKNTLKAAHLQLKQDRKLTDDNKA